MSRKGYRKVAVPKADLVKQIKTLCPSQDRDTLSVSESKRWHVHHLQRRAASSVKDDAMTLGYKFGPSVTVDAVATLITEQTLGQRYREQVWLCSIQHII